MLVSDLADVGDEHELGHGRGTARHTSHQARCTQTQLWLIDSGGMIVLTGALGALDETPAFVGYGMAKSAVHQVCVCVVVV